MNRRPGENDKRDRAGEPNADTDANDFAREMADVVPLTPDPRGRVRAAPPISAPRASTESRSSAGRRDATDASDDSFVAPGVDRREIRKLKRGDYVPGSRLDLHGMTAADAIERVNRFIDNNRRNPYTAGPTARTTLCIVHGRGLHSQGSVSILRTRVRECLRQHRAVLAYADAPRSDGGAGAVYVLLRK